MKDYLRELQTLVPLDKDQKPGTLGLLKEVLGRMKMLSKGAASYLWKVYNNLSLWIFKYV